MIIEPFNMRREMQEGSFDEEGNYTWWRRNKDSEAVHDGWLDSLDAGDSLVSFKVNSSFVLPLLFSPSCPPSWRRSASLLDSYIKHRTHHSAYIRATRL